MIDANILKDALVTNLSKSVSDTDPYLDNIRNIVKCLNRFKKNYVELMSGADNRFLFPSETIQCYVTGGFIFKNNFKFEFNDIKPTLLTVHVSAPPVDHTLRNKLRRSNVTEIVECIHLTESIQSLVKDIFVSNEKIHLFDEALDKLKLEFPELKNVIINIDRDMIAGFIVSFKVPAVIDIK